MIIIGSDDGGLEAAEGDMGAVSSLGTDTEDTIAAGTDGTEAADEARASALHDELIPPQLTQRQNPIQPFSRFEQQALNTSKIS